MNARQTKKKLKVTINKLKRDNDLMRDIIANSHEMQELYDLYNSHPNINVSTVQVQEYRVCRDISLINFFDSRIVEEIKRNAVEALIEAVKDCICIEVSKDYKQPTITASIIVGRK